MIKVIMHGCNGRMGRVISALIDEEENLEIVAGIDEKLIIPKNSQFLIKLINVM